jgi:hypothetical protein
MNGKDTFLSEVSHMELSDFASLLRQHVPPFRHMSPTNPMKSDDVADGIVVAL